IACREWNGPKRCSINGILRRCIMENNDMQAKVVATFKNAESLITGATKEPLAENQNLFLIVDASVNKEGITDIKTFCETRGIDATSVQKIGRLLAFSEELL